MQVDIAVPGTFQAFKFGRQLEKRECLGTIYTTAPRHKGGVSSDRVENIRHPWVIQRIGDQWPRLDDIVPSRWRRPFTQWKNITFDKAVSRRLEPVDDGIFVGYAGVCLESLQRANALGLTTVVERESTHIRTQKEILDEEYQKYNQGRCPISDDYVEREEKEYKLADYITTPSRFAQESFVQQGYDEQKVKRVPFGVVLPELSDVNGVDTTYFIYAGSVILRKGIQYLLPAWDSLDLPNAELIVAGNITESTQPIVQSYMDAEDIHFLGWVNNINELFGKSSVFVFPTLEEGSALVVYEAMASGLPIVTTYNSGWVGEDGKHGIEVPVRDSESVAEAMQYLYNNPDERKRMGENARNHIASNFTEDDYGKRMYFEHQAMIRQ